VDVSVDGEGLEGSIGLSRTKHLLAVGVELDGTDACVSEQFACEDAATRAREEVEFSHRAPTV
jgi:hypothetical protein